MWNIYDNYVNEVINSAFETSNIQTIYSNYALKIEDSVLNEESGYSFLESSNDFQIAISELMSHAQERASAVYLYLN